MMTHDVIFWFCFWEGLCHGNKYSICKFLFFFLTLVSFFFWMLLEICMYIDKIFFPQMGLVEGLVSLMLLHLFV